MSYVYLQSEPGLYTVGFYKPDGKWQSESDHASREIAAARVAYLNGGEAEHTVEDAMERVRAMRDRLQRAVELGERLGCAGGAALEVDGQNLKPPLLCRLGFHRWGKPYLEMDNGHMEQCSRSPLCDAVHEVITDPDGAL